MMDEKEYKKQLQLLNKQRDQCMCEKILDAHKNNADKNIIVLVGSGHVAGMQSILQKSKYKVEALSVFPSKEIYFDEEVVNPYKQQIICRRQ